MCNDYLVWAFKICSFFSFSAMTDTRSRSFECALVSVVERYEGLLASGNSCTYFTHMIFTYLNVYNNNYLMFCKYFDLL